MRFDAGGDETEGPLLLGMTIERDVRRQPGGESQRIAILGDADFGSSQFLGNGGNQMFAESLMLWLTGDSNESDFNTRGRERRRDHPGQAKHHRAHRYPARGPAADISDSGGRGGLASKALR